MKGKVTFAIVAVVFAVLAGAASAYAQDTAGFKVPFAFVVEGKQMPAGTYVIQQHGEDPLSLQPTTGATIFVPFVTRLGRRGAPLEAPEVVFDKAGNTYYLSEVWMPEFDGWLVRATKGAHEHNVVKGQKSKKG